MCQRYHKAPTEMREGEKANVLMRHLAILGMAGGTAPGAMTRGPEVDPMLASLGGLAETLG